MKRKQVTKETNMKFGLIAPSWRQRTPQGNCDSRGHIHCLKIRSYALRELDIKTDWLSDWLTEWLSAVEWRGLEFWL